ncbi:MAG: N-acetylgalactosamine-4-sulfatase, partial [Verrucomicrobia bacterium]|nr:N-acetylgalactosamine-4-sulfatase [Verrucomicrobiota bacterium]
PPPGQNAPGAPKAYRTAAGVAVPATKAVLRIDGKELERKPVGPKDIMITFTADLTAGSHKFSPLFLTEAGEIGAFYAILTKK